MPTQSPDLPAGLTVAQWYPQQVEQLIASHRKLPDHRLELAIWFDTDSRKDVHLLEVLANFPRSENPTKFYTSEFDSGLAFPMPAGGRLMLIMTNGDELREALTKRHPQVARLRKAFVRNAAHVVYRSSSPRIKELVEGLMRAR
jgi:hypothetical protein